jgi:hypothetical protein
LFVDFSRRQTVTLAVLIHAQTKFNVIVANMFIGTPALGCRVDYALLPRSTD